MLAIWVALGESGAAQEYRAVASSGSQADAARSATLIEPASVELAAPENVGDLVSLAGGLVLSRTTTASAMPILRGLTGSSVLLMADDLRLNDSLTRAGGNALLNLIDPASVQEIEIIRGPASVRYGSDALGGVVRVVTAGPANPDQGSHAGARLRLRAASAERGLRLSGAVYGSSRGYGARLSGGRGHAGLLLRGGGLGEQPYTGHDDATFASRLQWSPSVRHELALSHQSGHLWDVPRSDVSTPQDVQTTASLDRDAALLSYTGSFPDARLSVHAFTGMSLRRELRLRERPGRRVEERDRVLSYQFGVQAIAGLGSAGSLELGGDAVLDRVGSGTSQRREGGALERGRGRYVDGSLYDMGALYALWSLPLAAHWSLFTGGRISLIHAAAPSDPLFDPALQQRLDQHLLAPSGSLGARFDVSEQHAVMLSVLTGFRAPNLEDFQAFGGGARGFTVPNPGLHEERAYTLELGYQLHQPRVQGSVYLFASVLSGLLVRVPGTWAGAETVDGEPVLQRQNASSAVLMGAEGELRARLSAGFYAAAAAWAVWGETTRMSETGAELVEPASKIPGPAGALRAGFEHAQSPFVAEAAISAQLPQPRLSEGDKLDVRLCPLGPEGCDRVAGYVDVTARAGLRVGEHWLLSLSLENLLNVAYRTHASGAYAPGRNLVLALRGTL